MIEGDDFGLHAGSKEIQSKIGRRKRARDGDFLGLHFAGGEGTRRHDHRAIAFANAPAASHQGVLILDVGIRVKRDRGDIVNAFAGFLVQGLAIAERVREAQARGAALVSRQAVKHVRIVGIGAVSDGDLADLWGRACGIFCFLLGHGCHGMNSNKCEAMNISRGYVSCDASEPRWRQQTLFL